MFKLNTLCIAVCLMLTSTISLAQNQPKALDHSELPEMYILEVDLNKELGPAMAKVRACYQEMMPSMANADGEIKVKIKTNKANKVTSVTVGDSPFSKKFHDSCVIPPFSGVEIQEKHLSPATLSFSIVLKRVTP